MKLKLKLLVVFSLVLGISLAAVSYLGYSYAKKQLVTSIKEQMLVTAEGNTHELDGWLVAKSKTAETICNTIESSVGNGPVPVSYLHAYKKDPALSDLYIGFTDGTFLDGSGWTPPASYAPQERVWYQRAIEKNGLIFSAPYLDAVTGKYAVSVALPLKDTSGTVRGVLSEDILLETLTQKVEQMNLSGKGYGFMLDTNGVAIAHPDKKLVSTNLLKNPATKKLAEQMLSKDQGLIEYDLKGQQLIVFQKLPSSGWVFGMAIPKDVAYQELANLSSLKIKFATVGIVVLLLVALLTLIFANRITRPIQDLAHNAEKLATGDLTVRTAVYGNDEVSEVSSAFNRMVDNLRTLVQEITSAADLVGTTSRNIRATTRETGQASEQIAATITDVARDMSNQAQGVQKGAQMVTEMVQAIENIKQGMEVSFQRGEEAHASVKQGFEAVMNQLAMVEENRKASTAVAQCIDALAANSSRIGQIVEVISDIAGQTNLLALNAAIEAARAGEHGREFAVVAEEVRKLAEESATSSQEISSLIQETQISTEQAVKEMRSAEAIAVEQARVANEARDYFDIVKESVDNITSHIRQIAVDVNKLNLGASQVSATIHDIEQLSARSAANSEKVAAATQQQTAAVQDINRQAERLAEEADRLLEGVKQFTV
ncbi:MAG: methyl-accepting chemotaxis protein [Syntrophomonadaceae bacterium]|jgi:methyl-accepting chemotaxis protein